MMGIYQNWRQNLIEVINYKTKANKNNNKNNNKKYRINNKICQTWINLEKYQLTNHQKISANKSKSYKNKSVFMVNHVQ